MYGEDTPYGSPDDPVRKQQVPPDYGREYEGRSPAPSDETEQEAIDKELGQSDADRAEVAEYLAKMQARMRQAGKNPKHIQPKSDEEA